MTRNIFLVVVTSLFFGCYAVEAASKKTTTKDKKSKSVTKKKPSKRNVKLTSPPPAVMVNPKNQGKRVGGQVYNSKEPIDMQQVFRASKKKKRMGLFRYSRHCGRYYRSRHLASICVLESGRIFGGIPANIDQNDRIVVYLIARDWLSHLYQVRIAPQTRVSALETDEIIPPKELNPTAKPKFIVKRFVFGPFPGGAVVLAISRPAIGRPGLGRVWVNYVIPINTLSLFSVAIGLVGIYPPVSKYVLLRDRGASVQRISLSDPGLIGLDVTIFAKFYSWQVWDPDLFAGRDLRKPPTFIQRFNLNIGFSLQNLFTSFFVGVGFEIQGGLDIVVGANFRIQDELAGGYKVGHPFQGYIEELPLTKQLRVGFFFGVSITPEILAVVIQSLTSTRGTLSSVK